MKTPKPRKLPSGNWFIQLRLGGESVSVTESTEKKCIQTARLLKAEYLAGKREQNPEEITLTLKQAMDSYISTRSNTLSPSTIRGYQAIRDTRFKDALNRRIDSVADWQAICNAEARLCSAKTLKNAWMFAASAIRHATGQPVQNVKLPQVIIHEKKFLEPEQIPIFVKGVFGLPCEIPALLALHGLRRSELYALTWENVDLEKGRIFVDGAVVMGQERTYVTKKETKNQKSRRYVPIMIPELKSALSSCEVKEGSVIKTSPNSLYAQINRVCAANHLPLVGVHGLRHSFASLAYHLNVPEKITMHIGGWSDYETMRKIYTHLAQKDISKYETELSGFFKNANGNANE